MSNSYTFYVGIDLGSKEHVVCVTDADGNVLEEFEVKHSGRAVGDLVMRLMRICDNQAHQVAIGVEQPHGAVVEWLLDHRFHVYSINPKQVDRFRDRFSPAGAKDDRRDALVLASAVRTDRHAFRQVLLDDPQIIELREISRMEQDLAKDLRRLTNRLWAQLQRYYPQILEFSSGADEPWIWALLVAAPTPQQGSRLRRPTIERLLRKHRIRRLTVDDVQLVLKTPALQVAPGLTESLAVRVQALLSQLQMLHQQHKQVERQVAQALEHLEPGSPAEDMVNNRCEHRDCDIILSVPGIGIKTTAAVLAEAQQAIRERDYHTLRTRAGSAPVTKASGKARRVVMRRACNKRLRNAMHHMAMGVITCDPSSRAYYDAQRARGHNHSRALRAVSDRLLRILVALLRDGTLYDPTRPKFGNQQRTAISG